MTISPQAKQRLNNTGLQVMPKAARILKQAQSDNFNSAVARNNHRKYETSDSIQNFK